MAILADRTHLYPRNCNRLSRRVREFVVSLLGDFIPERTIVRLVREEFDIALSQPAVHHYTISPVWGPEVRARRQEFREQLELRCRLASPVARVADLCQAAERHQERRDHFRRLFATVRAELERLRQQDREARAGRHGMAPVPADVLALVEAQARDLQRAEDHHERFWHLALAGIRDELWRGPGLGEERDDSAEAAEFIR